MWSRRKSAVYGRRLWRSRGFVRRVLRVAGVSTMAGALAFSILPATASPIAVPALPNWFADLGTARPEPDQLQDRLDAVYTNFMGHGGYTKAIADGCVDVVSASHAAGAARTAVDKDWNDLNAVFDAMTATQVSAGALLATRSAELLAKILAFQAKMAAAALGKAPAVAHSISSFTAAVAKGAVDVYEGVIHGNHDVGKNSQDAISVALKVFKGSFSTLAGVGLDAVSQGQSILAIVQDMNQLQRDSGALTSAYFAAGNRYSTHLNAYEKAMTNLSTQQRTKCPPKPTPTAKTALPSFPNRAIGAAGIADAGVELKKYCTGSGTGVSSTPHPGSALCGKSPVNWEKVCQTGMGIRYHAYKWAPPHDWGEDNLYPSGIVCVVKLA